ncbi:MAG: hypothetical protein QM831_44255 [Kofleriaceae bacterium]
MRVRTIGVVMLLSASSGASPRVHAVKDPTPAQEKLRGELYGQSDEPPAMASTKVAHFRPLCDAEGFPLVGNLSFKGEPRVTVSTFCAWVRETKAKKSW